MYYRTYRNRCVFMPDLQEIAASPTGMILVKYSPHWSHARCVIIDRVCSALIVLAGRVMLSLALVPGGLLLLSIELD
jgi:hypothetical protein